MIGATVAAAALAWTAPFIAAPARASHPLEGAKWIWAHGTAEPVPTIRSGAAGTVTFLATFRVETRQEPLTLHLTADNRAVAFLNGIEIGKVDDWSRIHKLDLGPHAHAGQNELRIIATNDASRVEQNPGGLIAAVRSGSRLVLASGREWRAERDGQPLSVAELGPPEIAPWNLRGENPAPPLLRREFQIATKPKEARLRIIGLGDYRVYVNGHEVSREHLLQPWSQFDKALYWREFAVGPLLRKGANAIAVQLGNSFWLVAHPGDSRYFKGDAMPQFGAGQPYLLSLELTSPEGVLVTSDAKWRYASSPITFSHVQAGEDYDARLEPKGWMEPAFDDDDWADVAVASTPIVDFRRQNWPAVRRHEAFEPVRWLRRPNGHWSAVFAQNASAILSFTVKGRRGQTVVFRPSETMTREGDVQQLNLWGREVRCAYTLGGNDPETHAWQFFYFGFQFVDVEGAVPAGEPNPNGLPVIERLTMHHVRTANPEAGAFVTSSKLLNDTHALIDWAMRSNMTQSMTDCPHREKMGWLECAYLLAPTFSYRYACKDWMAKIAADIRDAQQKDGLIPTVAPTYLMLPFDNDFAFTVEWGAAGVFLPWHLYTWYGDRQTLATSFASMKAFVDYLLERSTEGIAPAGLGDWYDYGHGQGPGPSRFTPQDLSATATLAMACDVMVKAAEALGKPAEATRYRAHRKRIGQAFLARFYDPKTKLLTHRGSPQAGHTMALCADLVPEADRDAVLDHVLKDLEARDYQQTAGDVGHLYFIRALAEAGRSDVLHRVYARTGTGSYGGILAKGLTTLPETWDAMTVGSNSLNHCMLGHVMEWFYGYVLGVRQAEGSVGWAKALVAPEPGALSFSEGAFDSPKGKIGVQWTVVGDTFTLGVTVPKGMTALLVPPPGFGSASVGGQEPLRAVEFKGRRGFEVGPGAWYLRAER